MKAVLISIQPKWCELIASGKKTIEVRKTAPKLETPFKVYVYQTKHKGKSIVSEALNTVYGGGKVIGSFVCDKIYDITPVPYYEETCGYKIPQAVIDDSCLTAHDIIIYLTRKDTRVNAYGWHISDLKIYDKPRELSDFSKYGYKYLGGCCVNNNCKNYVYNGYYQPPECKIDGCFSKRPPQSWMYVEEL